MHGDTKYPGGGALRALYFFILISHIVLSVPLVGANGDIMALNCGTAAFVYTEDHLRREIAPRLLKMARALATDIGGHVPAPH